MADNFLTPDGKDAASNGCAFFGEGVKFKGSISVPEKIVVHGTLEGDVESRELFVGPNGVIKGSVRVDQADVQGKIFENIEVKVCLSLRKTGQIEGKAVYGEIEIEKGGVLSGEVHPTTDKPELEPVQLKKAANRGYDGPQLASVDLPELGAAARSEAKPRPDVTRLEVKSRPDAATRLEAKKVKDETEDASVKK